MLEIKTKRLVFLWIYSIYQLYNDKFDINFNGYELVLNFWDKFYNFVSKIILYKQNDYTKWFLNYENIQNNS